MSRSALKRKSRLFTRAATRELCPTAIKRARELMLSQRFDEAAAAYKSILAVNPRSPDAMDGYATALMQLGRLDDAYTHFKAAVTTDPENSEIWLHFGACVERMKHSEAALIAYAKAVEIGPVRTEMYVGKARVHHALGQIEDALAAADMAFAINPQDVDASFQRGVELQSLGKFAGARDAFLDVLKLEPDAAEAHFRLIEMGETAGHEDEVVNGLTGLARDKSASSQRRASACFAAGRLRHDQGQFDLAFELYAQGNAISRPKTPFNRAALTERFNAIIDAFDAKALGSNKGAGHQTEQPVFVIGMPRSGSTLVEQIISCHNQVSAAGELNKIAEVDRDLAGTRFEGGLGYPQDLAEISSKALAPMGIAYLDSLWHRGGAENARIVDKNLFNFQNLGLVSVLFPNARVIHCRRDPRDLALSCFFQNFTNSGQLTFTYDLGDIGFYLSEYLRLMAHWRKVLPTRMYEVDYEAVVSNQAEVSRELIDSLGLDWDPACLKPQDNGRAVRTASFWQVRQPVYVSSVDVWRNYESHLEPVIKALNDLY